MAIKQAKKDVCLNLCTKLSKQAEEAFKQTKKAKQDVEKAS